MNEEQLQAYTNLPPAESCRLIDFDRVEIAVLESFPPQHVLTVTGTKPFLNMEVDLVPLVFVRQPEYWGIEVVGCLRGIGLPALAPYTVSMPLDGFVGTEGIEVIGATRSEKIEVASERPVRDCGDWTAVHDREPPGPAVLRVRGRCRFPIPIRMLPTAAEPSPVAGKVRTSCVEQRQEHDPIRMAAPSDRFFA